MNRLWLMDDIIEEMKEKYGDERIWILETRGWDLTNTPKHRNSDKDRNDWADKAVNYPSDIWFYALPDKDKPELTQLMEEYKLKWYVDEILLLKNKNPENRSEACANEKWMHDRFNLKD